MQCFRVKKLHCVRPNSMSLLANYLPQKAVVNITWRRKIKAISVDQLTTVRVTVADRQHPTPGKKYL